MSKEAAHIAQKCKVREGLETHLDSREVSDANDEYARGELEEMGSRELLDEYAE